MLLLQLGVGDFNCLHLKSQQSLPLQTFNLLNNTGILQWCVLFLEEMSKDFLIQDPDFK